MCSEAKNTRILRNLTVGQQLDTMDALLRPDARDGVHDGVVHKALPLSTHQNFKL